MSASAVPQRVIGRYALFDEVASGGMATVHVGRMAGPAGFSRVVAMKRMHPQFAKDPEFVAMFLDEARLAGRIRHPNVVPTLDIVAEAGELFIVMEYVEGESLSRLVKLAKAAGEKVPVPVAAAMMVQALHGLHAAHEAKSDGGAPLGIIHRDVSPQNLLCGVDGLVRVVDFGIARARGRSDETRPGVVKGKAAYLAPEQLRAEPIDRRVDVYAAGVVLWELLTGERLFSGDDALETINQVLRGAPRVPPSTRRGEVPKALDTVVLRATEGQRDARYATALDLADAIEAVSELASQRTVGKWVEAIAARELDARRQVVSRSSEATADVTMQVPVGRGASEAPPRSSAPPPSSSRPIAADVPGIEHTKSVVRSPGAAPVSGPPPAPATGARARSRQRPPNESLLIAALLGAIALGGTVLVVRALKGGSASAGASATGTASATATASAAAGAEATASAEATATASAEATATASAEANASAMPSASSRPSASTRPKAAGRCSPPYYYEDGFKKFKPGCL